MPVPSKGSSECLSPRAPQGSKKRLVSRDLSFNHQKMPLKYFPSLRESVAALAFLSLMASNAGADSQVLKGGAVQSIFLTSPSPGSEVKRGEELTVTWASKNIEYVDVVPMKGAQEIGKLAHQVTRGSAKVKIPNDIAPSPDQNQFTYYIGIYSKSKMVKDKRLVIIK